MTVHMAAGSGFGRRRAGYDLREFVRAHRRLLAVDFFTVETMWLQRLAVLFFIELPPCTSRAARRIRSAPWVSQQARQPT
jgi:hypothetical protein